MSKLICAILGACLAACGLSSRGDLSFVDPQGGVVRVVHQEIDEGSTTPVHFTQALANNGPCVMAWSASATTATGAGWLTLSPASGTLVQAASADLTLTVNVSPPAVSPALLPGTYTGSVRVSATCTTNGQPAKGSPLVLTVNITVRGRRAILSGDESNFTQDIVLPSAWRTISTVGAQHGGSNGTHVAWTGYELLVYDSAGVALSAYDPDDDSWRTLSVEGAPSSRTNAQSVWTGTELIVWSGQGPSPGPGQPGPYLTDGGAYNPTTNTWRTLRPTGLPASPARTVGHAVWTGTHVVFYGGILESAAMGDTLLYQPATDTWSVPAASPLGAPRTGSAIAWTGTEVLVWGGLSPGTIHGNGAAYNPATNTWRTLSGVGAPSARRNTRGVWTGRHLLVWGGWQAVDFLADGSAYDPEHDKWTALPATTTTARMNHHALWTGTHMLVWGGAIAAGGDPKSGAFYAPYELGGTWSDTPTFKAPDGPCRAAVWTGVAMLVVGCGADASVGAVLEAPLGSGGGGGN